MNQFALFGNNYWPATCFYNVIGKVGGNCEGTADVEVVKAQRPQERVAAKVSITELVEKEV